MNTVIKFPGAAKLASKPVNRGSNVDENARSGFRLVYRSMKNASWYKDPIKKSVMLHLILDVAHEARAVTFGQTSIMLQRGQLVCSARSLGIDCGVSDDQARRALEFFEQTQVISRSGQRGKNGYTVITLLNFDAYQRGLSQIFERGFSADSKPASAQGLQPDSQISGADLGAELHAEDYNNKNIDLNKEDLKHSCPVSGETERHHAEQPSEAALLVLEHLNAICSRHYRAKPVSLRPINARLADGYEPTELQLVVDFKHAHWGADLRMAEYLRPATLFNPSKFEGYLAAARRWVANGKPRCINGEWEGFERRKPLSNLAAAQQQAQAMMAQGGVSYDDDTPL